MKRILSVRNFTVVGLILGLAGCVTKPPTESHARSESQAGGTASNPLANASQPSVPAPPMKEPTGALTLRDALALALTQNPELAPFAWQERANEARILQAGLRPNPQLDLQLEDVLGTGDFSGGQEAQITLQLSQAIELGGKRAARTELASRARGVTESEYEWKRVDVLGDVT